MESLLEEKIKYKVGDKVFFANGVVLLCNEEDTLLFGTIEKIDYATKMYWIKCKGDTKSYPVSPSEVYGDRANYIKIIMTLRTKPIFVEGEGLNYHLFMNHYWAKHPNELYNLLVKKVNQVLAK